MEFLQGLLTGIPIGAIGTVVLFKGHWIACKILELIRGNS